MRVIFGFAIIVFCLSGCSEMKVIGNAAMRELRADAVSVNWNKTVAINKTPMAQTQALVQTASAKEKTFSAFRKNPTNKRTQMKGLWEQQGS